jgi:multidrug transporter EmrE-like cation transporter
VAIVIGNMAFNILSNVCFKYSTISTTLSRFLSWQVVGNLAGFVTVITLTWLLRFIPLHVAFPLTTGLAVIGVNIIGSMIFFKEPISITHWLGTLLIILGIILVTS